LAKAKRISLARELRNREKNEENESSKEVSTVIF
jgi:hypothetical protein